MNIPVFGFTLDGLAWEIIVVLVGLCCVGIVILASVVMALYHPLNKIGLAILLGAGTAYALTSVFLTAAALEIPGKDSGWLYELYSQNGFGCFFFGTIALLGAYALKRRMREHLRLPHGEELEIRWPRFFEIWQMPVITSLSVMGFFLMSGALMAKISSF